MSIITPLPTPPSRNDAPETFATKADSFLGSLPLFQSELNGYAVYITAEMDAKVASAEASSIEAKNYRDEASLFRNQSLAARDQSRTARDQSREYSEIAQLAAENVGSGAAAVSGATKWEAGFYADEAVVWSPINGFIYRKVGSATTTVDPAIDSEGWVGVGAIVLAKIQAQAATSVFDVQFVAPVSVLSFGQTDDSALRLALDYRVQGAAEWTRTAFVSISSLSTHNFSLTGLTANTAYEYRGVATDVLNPGVVVFSNIMTQLTNETPAVTIDTPTLTVQGAPNDVPGDPSLLTSAFSTSGPGSDTHLNTDWQILDGATVVWESLANSTNKTSITVPVGVLTASTTYTFRVRHRGTTFGASDWAEVVATTLENLYIVTPTLTVQGAPNDVPERPDMSTGGFSTTGGSDTHLNTDWQILSGSTVIWESLADSVNKLTITVPAGVLEVNTEYTFRVRHRGTTYGASAWAEVVATTLAQFEVLPLMAVAHSNTPSITIYNQEIDTFTKLANPAVLPNGSATSVAISSDDVYMAVAHASTPFITIYKRSGDTFTKLTNPDVLPSNAANGVAFSSDAVYMAVANGNTPFITIYKRSGDTFTKLANPDVLPTGIGYCVAFSNNNTYMSVGHLNTPFITIYKRSGDTFTKLANPAVLPSSSAYGVAFSIDDVYLAVGHASTPFITIYKRSGDTFTKLANPTGGLPTGLGTGVAFTHGGFPQ